MTKPSHASSLVTAIDRVEERMALTELKQKTQEEPPINPQTATP